MWHTYMYTANIDGSNLQCTLPQSYWKNMISHQIWGRTPDEILIDCKWADDSFDYVVFDNRVRPPQAKLIAKGQGPMGHLVFSPDNEWMLADTYIQDGFQSLALIKVATGELKVIGKFHNDGPFGDTRCDLHPRWSADGSKITVDAKHDGKRAIYYLKCDDSVKF
jgi:Tol biopolymer transport system component